MCTCGRALKNADNWGETQVRQHLEGTAHRSEYILLGRARKHRHKWRCLRRSLFVRVLQPWKPYRSLAITAAPACFHSVQLNDRAKFYRSTHSTGVPFHYLHFPSAAFSKSVESSDGINTKQISILSFAKKLSPGVAQLAPATVIGKEQEQQVASPLPITGEGGGTARAALPESARDAGGGLSLDMEEPQRESPLPATDKEGSIVLADEVDPMGGVGGDECEVLRVGTPSCSPSPASSTTTPPACSGYKPPLGYPMGMNWPFGLSAERQPWVLVIRDGDLRLFAKRVPGEQTTGCMGTVATDGKACDPCQKLEDSTLLKGEMQKPHEGVVCVCPGQFGVLSSVSDVVQLVVVVRNKLRSTPACIY